MLIVGRYTCPSFSLIYSHLPHFSSAAHDSKIVWRNLVWLDDLRLQSGFDRSRVEQNGRKDELQFFNEYRDALRPRKLEGGWPVFGANTSRAKETKEISKMASSNQHLQFLYIYSQTEQESCKQAQDATHVGVRVIVCAFSERTNPTMCWSEKTQYMVPQSQGFAIGQKHRTRHRTTARSLIVVDIYISSQLFIFQ